MRRLLIWIGILVILFGMIIAGTKRLSARIIPMESAAMMFAAEQCSPQPCWRNIRPGHTTLIETETILQVKVDSFASTPDISLCWGKAASPCWNAYFIPNIRRNEPVAGIVILPSPGSFRLSDAIGIYGTPLTSTLCWSAGISTLGITSDVPSPLMLAYLRFRGGIAVVAYNGQEPQGRRLDPSMVIERIQYTTTADITTPPWRGFVTAHKLGCRG